ncbi:helix-turn-helix domain-containing protein [Pedobacter sp. MR2016-24]|uniref:helix-turn-helix domain-containing protein n=1 Tax=Pedobacter sp. MR2016-24 TaxID=2994466 RepID=UPI0022468323|nr:helix-turn-helix domain-containing protein [Pedobacter sp. MR2016-24]MCX2483558.1 helix-turn-helix domain-containing protein [Pedobacter sp. MR2016-24]
MNNIIKEITPLTQNDCFTIFSRVKNDFDFPLHFHEEFELNLILNAAGAKRIVGDNVEEISDMELVLVGPNLSHAWSTHNCKTEITEVTIQWHKDLFDDKLLRRNQLSFIRKMFERSGRGILFPRETIERLYPRILAIEQLQGFDSVLELMSILHDLSTSKSMRILSDATFNNEQILNYNSRRIDKAFEFMNANFDKQISLKDLSKLVSMTEVSFSRFIKKRTGNTFLDSLNEIRLGHATRMLIETTHSVAEISYNCGFNNISNFNRLFKRKKHCTPKEFRENFSGTRIFI